MKKIDFIKMHGLGNDFIIIKKSDVPIGCDIDNLINSISHRHLGIGCDQLIIYDGIMANYEMVIYNQDGSRASLCGNVARCLAKLIYLETQEKEMVLITETKRLLCNILDDGMVSVNIGDVCFSKSWMPSEEAIWQLVQRYDIDLKEAICVDVGNPHFVIFSALSDEDKSIVGEKLQDKELFKDGVNANFAEVRNDNIYLSVWERGVGFTLACGSGACASFAASRKLGFIHSDCNVIFKMGNLHMSQIGSDIIMTGSSNMIASGVYYYV